MIRADFQQGMESVSEFKMNAVTENYWLVYAAATVIWPYHVGIIFSHWVNLKLALWFHALLIVTILPIYIDDGIKHPLKCLSEVLALQSN